MMKGLVILGNKTFQKCSKTLTMEGEAILSIEDLVNIAAKSIEHEISSLKWVFHFILILPENSRNIYYKNYCKTK